MARTMVAGMVTFMRGSVAVRLNLKAPSGLRKARTMVAWTPVPGGQYRGGQAREDPYHGGQHHGGQCLGRPVARTMVASTGVACLGARPMGATGLEALSKPEL